MSLRSERYLPFAAAVLGAATATAVDAVAEVEPFSMQVSVGTMTLGVVVAGFTATQRNMLLGMTGTKVLRFAATAGYHRDVLDYLAHCIYAALFVTGVSAVGLFIEGCSWAWTLWLPLWSGSVVLVVALILRNERLMSRIFVRFMDEQRSLRS